MFCTYSRMPTVPLSGYSIQQMQNNNPNDTVPYTPRYFNLVPHLLNRKPGNFLPHAFNVGDDFQTNFSLFDQYVIRTAYNRTGTFPQASNEIPTFQYANHKLETCDVTQISITVNFQAGYSKATLDQIWVRWTFIISPHDLINCAGHFFVLVPAILHIGCKPTISFSVGLQFAGNSPTR